MFLQGSMTALATPFTSDGLDEETFANFVEWQIGEGTNGLVPCGTTGEGPTLTQTERDRLTRICVECASGAVPVVAGTGTNSTATTIEQTRAAKAAGADAALIVTPYYNRPTQEGLYRHFAAVAAAVEMPIILYNVPKRTGVDLGLDTIEQLARIPNIVGIKDASGDLDRPRATSLVSGPKFVQLSGDDDTAVAFNLAGGKGCISVLANVVPSLCRDLQRCCRIRDWAGARTIEHRLAPLREALARETNPGPIKHALSLLHPGFPREPRLPLVGVAPATASHIAETLADLGLVRGGMAADIVASLGRQDRQGGASRTLWRAE